MDELDFGDRTVSYCHKANDEVVRLEKRNRPLGAMPALKVDQIKYVKNFRNKQGGGMRRCLRLDFWTRWLMTVPGLWSDDGNDVCPYGLLTLVLILLMHMLSDCCK